MGLPPTDAELAAKNVPPLRGGYDAALQVSRHCRSVLKRSLSCRLWSLLIADGLAALGMGVIAAVRRVSIG